MGAPHKELAVWQQSMQLAGLVYACSASFPKDERYGLTTQLRRAVVSIPSNIAEGVARSSTKDYLRFLVVARGSLSEVDTQLELAVMFGYVERGHRVFGQLELTGKLLSGLIRSLKCKLEE